MLETPLHGARAEEVWALLAENVRPGPVRDVPVDACLGQVLARDARAALDYPPFDRAVMDGFAVRTADVATLPARLRISGLLRAGAAISSPIEPNSCVQINTGAAIPPGADAVVMVERVRTDDEQFANFDHAPRPGENIERRAALTPEGGLLVRAGVRVGPGTLAAMAAGGLSRVSCFIRPRVAILCTGDELVAPGVETRVGQIHDSNGALLDLLVREYGGEAIPLERCPDEPARLRAALELGLSHDLLCVTGGMSKGSHDLVPGLLEQLGVRWLVKSLDLKPGKPTRIGKSPAGGWVVGLPGNPVSCAVCFHLFAAPILRGLSGLGANPPPKLVGVTLSELPPNGPRPLFQPAEWLAGPGGEACVSPVAWRGSGDPFGLATANALIYRDSNVPAALHGERVAFVPLDRPA